MWVRSLGQEDTPEEGMATHSSIIDWTEERVGYSPQGCKESDMTEATQQQQQQSWDPVTLAQLKLG